VHGTSVVSISRRWRRRRKEGRRSRIGGGGVR